MLSRKLFVKIRCAGDSFRDFADLADELGAIIRKCVVYQSDTFRLRCCDGERDMGDFNRLALLRTSRQEIRPVFGAIEPHRTIVRIEYSMTASADDVGR